MMPEDVHEEKLSFLDFENKLLQTDGPMDKWTNGQMDKQMDQMMDGETLIETRGWIKKS